MKCAIVPGYSTRVPFENIELYTPFVDDQGDVVMKTNEFPLKLVFFSPAGLYEISVNDYIGQSFELFEGEIVLSCPEP